LREWAEIYRTVKLESIDENEAQARRRWRSYALMVLASLAIIWGAVSLYERFLRTPPPIPAPADLEKLDPQLRAYIDEQVSWVRQRPREPRRHAILGMVYAANGLWPEAQIAFRTVTELEPDEPHGHLYLGVSHLEMGELEQALELFRQLTKQFPSFAPGFYRLGDTALRLGYLDEAERAFSRLIELAPGEWRGYAGMGDVMLQRKNFQEAAKWLEGALRISPDARIAHHLLGLAYRGLGRMEEAEWHLHAGMDSLHFPMPDAWSVSAPQHMKTLLDQLDMAMEYSQAGEFARAIQILEAALPWHSTNVTLLSNLGLAHNNVGDPEQAYRYLSKALEIAPRYVPAQVFMASTLLNLGQFEEARKQAETTLALAPGNLQAYAAKANALLALGETEEAYETLVEAIRIAPENVVLHLETGDLALRVLGRPEAALEHYLEASALAPEAMPVLVRLSDTHIRLNQPEPARQALEAARQISPNEPVIEQLEQRLASIEGGAENEIPLDE
jgi:tetratricopeptide (TPR) repeat protein